MTSTRWLPAETDARHVTGFAGRLRAHGWRLTRERWHAASAIANKRGAFTSEALVRELHAQHVSRATVYRTLALLVHLQVIARVLTSRRWGYVVCDESVHHHHLACDTCGTIAVVQSPALEAAIDRVADVSRFQLQAHVLELAGRCAECLQTS